MKMNMYIKTRDNLKTDEMSKVYFIANSDDADKYFEIISDMILECENCAIYYDKITENINIDDIKQMDLIVIAVTKNFVHGESDADNIVFECASENNIPVLPIIMEQLDSSETALLDNMLKNTIYCSQDSTVPDFKAKFSEYLRNVLKTNGDDPLHIFNIGMSYLEETNSEKNIELALNLITNAANAGLAEAMKKLAIMYRTGDVVEYSIDKSIEWQKKYADSVGEIYKQSEKEADGLTWIDSLMDLENIYLSAYDTVHINEAYKTIKYVFKSAADLNSCFDSKETKERLAHCDEIYGDISDALQIRDDAMKCYEQAISECKSAIIETLKEEGATQESLIGCYFNNSALINHICREGINILPIEKLCVRLIDTVYKWAELHIQFSDENVLDDVLNEINIAITCAKLIIQSDPSAEMYEYLYKGFICMGDIYFRDKTYGKARPCFGEAMKGYTMLCGESSDIKFRLGLFDSTIKLAQSYGEDGMLNKGAVYYEKSLDLAERLAKEQSSPIHKINLAYCLSICADLERKYIELLILDDSIFSINTDIIMARRERAKNYFEQACNLIDNLKDMEISSFCNPEYRKMTMFYKKYNDFAQISGRICEAKGEYDVAAKNYIFCCSNMPSFEKIYPDEIHRLMLVSNLRDLGLKCEKANDRDLAQKCYYYALRCSSEAIDIYKNLCSYEAYVCVCYDYTIFYWNYSNEESIKYIEKSIDALNIIIEDFSDSPQFDPKFIKMREEAEYRLAFKKFQLM